MVKSDETVAALESFVGGLNGVDLHFHKGDLIAADHPAAQKWPDLFGPASLVHGVEQATHAPGEKRGA